MENQNKPLAFGRKNYLLMIVGIALLCIGLIIMTMDDQEYGLGFMGITLGPIVVISGLIVEFFAIMARSTPRK